MKDIEVLRRLAQIAEDIENPSSHKPFGGNREQAKQYGGELVQAVENMVMRWLVQADRNELNNQG